MNTFANRVLSESVTGWQAEVIAVVKGMTHNMKMRSYGPTHVLFSVATEVTLDGLDLSALSKLTQKHNLTMTISVRMGTIGFYE